jgi:hypothetical protein
MTDLSTRHSRLGAAWRRLDRYPLQFLTGLYVLCLLAFLVTVPLPRADGQLVGSDGIFYYAYLPTLLLDGDLDFTNQIAQLLPLRPIAETPHTSTGLIPVAQSVGPAVLWTPFFLVGHLLTLLLRLAGAPLAPDGVGLIYQVATLVGSITYGFLGLLLVYRSCCRFLSRVTSVLTVVLLWLATNVVYYMVAEPSMSHMCSLFAVALFVDLWLAARPLPTLRQWVLIGLAGGLVTLVRQPDATFLALPLLDALMATVRQKSVALLGPQAAGMTAFGVCAAIAFLPQMGVWWVLNGSPFTSGYVLLTETPAFSWLTPKIGSVLFSLWHGLYTWHPIFLAATVGLGWFYARERRLALLLGLGLALQVYVIGAWRYWHQGDAFGGRMFISSLPVFALGLAALIEWSVARGRLALVLAAGVSLIAWNALFFLQYRLQYIPFNAPITLEQLTVGKFEMLADLARRVFHFVFRQHP